MTTSARPAAVVIADAGPLIALGRLDLLALLPRLFAEVQVTETVLAECLARPDLADAVRVQAALAARHIMACPDVRSAQEGPLDPGESSAISRALDIGAGLIMDDRAAVNHARAAGLKVIGTLGVLVLAKRAGLVELIEPLIGQLQHGGHYLGEAIVNAALHAAGER